MLINIVWCGSRIIIHRHVQGSCWLTLLFLVQHVGGGASFSTLSHSMVGAPALSYNRVGHTLQPKIHTQFQLLKFEHVLDKQNIKNTKNKEKKNKRSRQRNLCPLELVALGNYLGRLPLSWLWLQMGESEIFVKYTNTSRNVSKST